MEKGERRKGADTQVTLSCTFEHKDGSLSINPHASPQRRGTRSQSRPAKQRACCLLDLKSSSLEVYQSHMSVGLQAAVGKAKPGNSPSLGAPRQIKSYHRPQTQDSVEALLLNKPIRFPMGRFSSSMCCTLPKPPSLFVGAQKVIQALFHHLHTSGLGSQTASIPQTRSVSPTCARSLGLVPGVCRTDAC